MGASTIAVRDGEPTNRTHYHYRRHYRNASPTAAGRAHGHYHPNKHTHAVGYGHPATSNADTHRRTDRYPRVDRLAGTH